VDGDRLAFWVASGGNSTLYLATAGQSEVREIVTFAGDVGQRGRNEPVWSPDGRYLVTGARPLSENSGQPAIVVEFTPEGDAIGEPRVVQGLPESWWDLEWLPDSESFLIVDGDVWLVSLDPEVAPANLTEEEPLTWSYSLSPDGQFIAISPEVRRGGAFWQLDFSKALAADTEKR
jgi:Tol biopolymer transport system component